MKFICGIGMGDTAGGADERKVLRAGLQSWASGQAGSNQMIINKM